MDIQDAPPAPLGEQLMSSINKQFEQIVALCSQRCPQHTGRICSEFGSEHSSKLRPIIALFTFSTKFISSSPSMYPGRSLAFVDGTMAIVLSRLWHEVLSTSMFRLHRDAFCEGATCDAEASFRVQLAYVIISLLPASMLKYGCDASQYERFRSLKSITSTTICYLVGWALRDALLQLQTESSENLDLCTPLLTNNGTTTAASDCSWFNAAYALLASALGVLYLCRLQPLILELAEGESAVTLIEAFCQLTFVAVAVALLVIWHSTLSSVALVGTQLSGVPVVELHILLLLAAAITGVAPVFTSRLQSMMEDLKAPMESAETSGRLINEARIRAAEAAEKARIARQEEQAKARAEELAARERAIAEAEARLEEAKLQKEDVDKDLAALSSRKLEIVKTESYGVFVDVDHDGVDDNTKLTKEKHESVFTGWLKSLPVLSPERFVDKDGDGLDDNTNLRYNEMQSKRWKPDPDGTGFIRMSTPREGEVPADSHVQDGIVALAQSTPEAQVAMHDTMALPDPVPLPVPLSDSSHPVTLTPQDQSSATQHQSPMHEMAYNSWLARSPAPPPTISTSPPPSPPDSIEEDADSSAELGLGSAEGPARIRTAQELFLASLLEMYNHSRVILGWLVAWAWVDVTGFFDPLSGTPTLWAVASDTLVAVLFTTAGYVCFLLVDASWAVTIDALPFFVGFTAMNCLRTLRVVFANMIVRVLDILPASSPGVIANSSQSSALIFVLLATWALFEAKDRFAQIQANVKMSTQPLLTEAAQEDGGLYNA